MKKYLILTLLLPALSLAQQAKPLLDAFPIKDGKVYYERIVDIDSVSKTELFKRAKVWALSSFASQKSALQSEDKEIGLLNYKTYITEAFENPKMYGIKLGPTYGKFWFTITFYFKEGRAKIVFDNVSIEDETDIENYEYLIQKSTPKSMKKRGYDKQMLQEAMVTFKKVNARFNELMEDCAKALSTKSEADF